MKGHINILVSALLLFMVLADIFPESPTLDDFVYYTFNVPYGSSRELLLWFVITWIALSNIIFLNTNYIDIFRKIGRILALFLLVIILYKIVKFFYFIFLGKSIVLGVGSSSIYSNTLGRLITLLMLFFSSLASIGLVGRNRKEKS
jgi:hypothetical protein